MSSNHPVTNEWYDAQVLNNPFIKENTKDTHISNLKTIKRLLSQTSTHEILINPTMYAHTIQSDKKIPENSRHTYLITILTYLRLSGLKVSKPDIFKGWYDAFNVIHEILKERENNNIPTERQTLSHMDWPDIITIRDKLPYASKEHLLLSLYTYVPPRRQMDYAKLRVYTDPSEEPQLDHNHLHIFNKKRNSPYIYVHDFKTAKYYKGFMNDEIPPEFIKIIKASLKKEPRQYLFEMPSGQPYDGDAKSFQRYSNRVLKRVLGNKGMSVNVIRHSYSMHLNSKPNITIGDREKNARKMGHSLRKNLAYALQMRDPPLSMLQSSSSQKGKEECYKKDPKTNKLLRITCP